MVSLPGYLTQKMVDLLLFRTDASRQSQSHGRYSGEALEEAIHLAKDRRWRTRKMIHLPSIALFIVVDDGPRLSLQNKNREKGRTSNAFF